MKKLFVVAPYHGELEYHLRHSSLFVEFARHIKNTYINSSRCFSVLKRKSHVQKGHESPTFSYYYSSHTRNL